MKNSVSGNSKEKKKVRVQFKMRRAVRAAGLLLCGLSLWHLAEIGTQSRTKTDIYHEMEKEVLTNTVADTEEERDEAETAAEEKKPFDYRTVSIDFDGLKEKNEDIIGWILFDYNGISYPVLQGEDNEEYLYLMADGTKNPAGSIFMDALCSMDFTDAHTILYGHNMKDVSMFGKLKYYRLSKDYYEENKYFTIFTPQEILRYVIFSWYEVEEDDRVYQVGFLEETFDAFAEEIGRRGLTDTKITAGGRDKVVTLSTCSVEGKRFVVHGKLIYKWMTE